VAKTNNGLVAVAVFLGITALTPAASARDQLRIVGSSTVYPFTTAVAEQFGKATGARTPVIESTGTGGGMKIFCEGIGVDKVDVTNASRRMKKGEFDACQKNGVTEIIEVNIGFDGLTMAQSKTGAPMKLTLAQVFLALAEQVPAADGKLVANPHKLWSDIDRSLPSHKIEVLGPPPTSGTRDSLHELFLEKGAEQIPELKALKSADPKAFEKIWKSIRRDGAYVEAGENDNVIVQKLEINKDALGVFGYSFLEENAAKLRGVAIDNADPTFENIANGKYKGARRMYVYFKKQHFGVIPGLDKFMAQYVSEKTLGQDGALARKGLVPLPKAEFEAMRKAALAGETTKADALTN
jgi:phosphate transport system substrate-binding protein